MESSSPRRVLILHLFRLSHGVILYSFSVVLFNLPLKCFPVWVWIVSGTHSVIVCSSGLQLVHREAVHLCLFFLFLFTFLNS